MIKGIIILYAVESPAKMLCRTGTRNLVNIKTLITNNPACLIYQTILIVEMQNVYGQYFYKAPH